MNRLDRYLLVQQLGPFGFFALALTGIIWLGQTIPLMEIIIDNGHSGFIFLEFATLILPNVLVVVLPISAFVSTLYSVNRLFSESEMVVILSSGLSPTRIIRATVVVGLIVLTGMVILLAVLQPRATTRLADRIAEVRQDSISALLREQQFIHPAKGVTIYIRESSNAGEIRGMFLHDQRDALNPVTYAAKQALLLQDAEELRLIMDQGVMQRFSTIEKNLITVEFDQFVFDLTGLVDKASARRMPPKEYYISDLLDPQKIIDAGGQYSKATYLAEGHEKLALPLLGLALPIFAFAMLMAASYRRTGLGARIALTGTVGILFVGLTLMFKTWVIANPDLFFVIYIPPVICLAIAMLALTKNRVKRTLYQFPART